MTFDPTDDVAVLERTPAVLRTLLDGLSEDWTHEDAGPETWSARDVVAHLIDAEETNWMVRVRTLLAQGPERRLESFDRFRFRRVDRGETLGELLDRFAELRARNLRELAELELDRRQLELTGEHPELGTVTLGQLLATWVTHDLAHLAQIARVMAKQNREAVGPWAAYLRVLHR